MNGYIEKERYDSALTDVYMKEKVQKRKVRRWC